MNAGYREWRVVVKLDPARQLDEERLEAVCSWPIDAIVVGGTGGYGVGEILRLLGRLKRYPLPLALEISDARSVCPGFDLYLVPMVLNSMEVDWVIGQHQAAVKKFGDLLDWKRVVVEGYCILNAEATAARVARARTDLTIDDVVAYARLAEHLLKLPIFYLEYSGCYGSAEVVRAAARVLRGTRLWYGGGIKTPAGLREMCAAADTVVIGNAVYEGDSPFGVE